jgi:hypothetical protein
MPLPHLRSEPLRQLAELLDRNVAIRPTRQAKIPKTGYWRSGRDVAVFT